MTMPGMPKGGRVVTVEELRGNPDFDDLDDAAKAHPIVEVDGVLRFQADPVARWFGDRGLLNDLWRSAASEGIPLESLARFYRDIGYSLAGYHEVITSHYEEDSE